MKAEKTFSFPVRILLSGKSNSNPERDFRGIAQQFCGHSDLAKNESPMVRLRA